MKKLGFILFILFAAFASCNNDDDNTYEQDNTKLGQMQSELFALSAAQTKTQTCTNPEDWGFATIESRCGNSFLLYSKKINNTDFLKKVEEYKKFYGKFIKRWGAGDCYYFNVIAPMTPTGIKCVDNKPQFIYPNLHN